ncbi:hypothetical protein V6R85_23930 [Agrobacterium sp. CCNWLW32]|uniref:hypothetical protein n=1 Tax=Agrobacterium sp. CCNWLW32 TaxID=3122072 RepID=UPI0030102EB6
MLEYIPDFSWQTWTAIGVGAFMVAPRIVSGAISIATLTALAGTAAVCLYVAGSTAIPMIAGSWNSHVASHARLRHYNDPAYRAKIASTVCPGYRDAGWINRTFKFETRLLSWCEAYPEKI